MIARLALRPTEAAEAAGLSRTRIFALLRSGELESIKVGRARLIPIASIEEFIERRRAEQSASVAW